MPDSTLLTAAHARHLLCRTGFGARVDEVATFAPLTRGAAADRLLAFKPQGFKPSGVEPDVIHDKWVSFMVKTKQPLQEKLVLFWHDHFATAFSKVQDARLMAKQNQLLRRNCKGNFRDLVKAINKDPAMMRFLDTTRNQKESPNENYARELLELFTLGPKDTAGNDNYAQADIVQIARAFTGWEFDAGKEAALATSLHDFTAAFPARGAKVIFASTGGFLPPGSGRSFTVGGEGANEIDEVIDIVLQHTDSDGKNTVARRIARRLIEYFAHPSPDLSFVDDVVGTGPSAFDATWDIAALLRRLFVHDAFYDTAEPLGPTSKRSVKWPVDYVVGTLRVLRMRLKGTQQFVDGGSYEPIMNQLANMGQVLFNPPSVFGWDWEMSWISSSTLLARYAFARDLTAARGGGAKGFHPEYFVDSALTDAAAIVDAVTHVLGITDELTSPERDALVAYLTNDGTLTPDLTNSDYRDEKLRGLFALALQLPAYQLH